MGPDPRDNWPKMFCSACGARLDSSPPVSCPSCGNHHWLNSVPTASGLIVKGDKVLLVKRGNKPWRGYWDVPGGFCEAYETPEQTALREIGEELGISVRIIQYHGSWIGNYRGPDSAGDDRILLCIYFLVEPADSEVRLEPNESEVLEARWFSKGEIPKEIGFPENNGPALARWEGADA